MPMSTNNTIGELLNRISHTDILQHKELLKALLESAAQQKDSRINNELLRELIQDYRHNAERLRESEHLYRSVIAAMEEGIVIQNSNSQQKCRTNFGSHTRPASRQNFHRSQVEGGTPGRQPFPGRGTSGNYHSPKRRAPAWSYYGSTQT